MKASASLPLALGKIVTGGIAGLHPPIRLVQKEPGRSVLRWRLFILGADVVHREIDQKPVANEMRMTKKPKITVPVKAFSSLRVFIAWIARIPTTGTVTIPVT